MFRKTAVALLVTAAFMPGAALAGMKDADLRAAFGTDEAAWATPVEDAELGGLRGGAGVLFSGFFDSTIDRASTASLPDGFTVSELGPAQVQVSSGLGNFDNFNGVLQLANVRGDFNTVRNVLNVNITINPPQSSVLGIMN
jgi:hypothetical protein